MDFMHALTISAELAVGLTPIAFNKPIFVCLLLFDCVYTWFQNYHIKFTCKYIVCLLAVFYCCQLLSHCAIFNVACAWFDSPFKLSVWLFVSLLELYFNFSLHIYLECRSPLTFNLSCCRSQFRNYFGFAYFIL